MAKMDVSKTFNRFTQRAGELVNKNQKTAYPTETAELIKQIESMKPWLTQLIAATEGFVDITVATKVIDTFQKNREKTTTTDKLGDTMETIAIQSESVAPNFALALKNTATVHQKMAAARKNFNSQTNTTFIDDLKTFVSKELEEALKAKNILEEARLDWDSNKSKLKNAKSAEQKAKLEAEIKTDESEFDMAHTTAISIFKNTIKTFDGLSIQLRDLVQAEKDYYEACAHECEQFLANH